MILILKILYNYRHKININFFFLIITSFLSSIFNAISAASLVPLISLLLNNDIDLKIINFISKNFGIDLGNFVQSDYVFIFLISFFISSILKVLNDFFIIKIRVQILSLYFNDIIGSFFLSDWHFFYKNDLGKISNSIYKELDKVAGSTIAVLHIFSNFLLISFITLVPLIISIEATLIMTVAILILFLPIKLLNYFFYKLGKKFTDESNIFSKLFFYAVSMYKNITANFINITIIKDINLSYKKINQLEIVKKVLNSSINEFLKIVSILIIVFIYTVSADYGLKLSEVTAILYSFARIAPYINDIISMFNVIENSRAGFELIEDLKKKSSIKNTWGTKSFANLNNNISFNNVSFVYPNGNLAIKNVSFKINKGEMVAFVGPSGSGKSTILDLIVGLNFPTNGKILIDGEQIDNFDKESYLKKIGYVDTNIDLFPYSIKKNVLIFNKEANQNDLINVYNFVNLKEEINKLNLGQETELQEKGALLSTGQKQRLCIARAIVKDPDLIVLDEATSFLDEKNEILILEKLKNMKSKTIIFATHKKNILKYFDKVFFVENKSVKLINNV